MAETTTVLTKQVSAVGISSVGESSDTKGYNEKSLLNELSNNH
jgi:hypothetical protein